MSIISRLTTWTIGQVLKAADLNGEFNNITNLFNNLDAGTTSWTTVKASTFTGGTLAGSTLTLSSTVNSNVSFDTPATHGIVGTTTNNSAAAGNVGEYVSSAVGATNAVTTSQYGDLTSISLTAGDWDVSAGMWWTSNTATWTEVQAGIGNVTGNSSAGSSLGDSLFVETFANTSTVRTRLAITIPSVRWSVASTTILYLKYFSIYTGGPPQALGRISARRVR